MKKLAVVLVASLALLSLFDVNAHADTISLNPFQDAELMQNGASGVVNGWNFGDSPYLTVNWGTGLPGVPSNTQFPAAGNSYGLLQFDLSSIPTGSTIDSATLTLYSASFASNTFSWPSPLHLVTSSWIESAVTYTSRPTWSTDSITHSSANAFPGGLPGYFIYDLATIAQGWLDGTVDNYGLVTSDTHLRAQSGGRYYARLYSSETTTGYAPRLDITYTPTAMNPTPEPATMILFGLGLLGLAGVSRKKSSGINPAYTIHAIQRGDKS